MLLGPAPRYPKPLLRTGLSLNPCPVCLLGHISAAGMEFGRDALQSNFPKKLGSPFYPALSFGPGELPCPSGLLSLRGIVLGVHIGIGLASQPALAAGDAQRPMFVWRHEAERMIYTLCQYRTAQNHTVRTASFCIKIGVCSCPELTILARTIF
jgi:hypothetical protein